MKYRIFSVFVILWSGCGADIQSENYGLSSISDLTLKSSNHVHGYGKSQCFSCHVNANIHQVDRLSLGNLSIARDLSKSGGLTTCSGCHGSNGVQP